MILRTPLAKEAGGYGWCKDGYGQSVVFRDTSHPDYQAILRAIQAAKTRQEKLGRYDMPGWRPSEHNVAVEHPEMVARLAKNLILLTASKSITSLSFRPKAVILPQWAVFGGTRVTSTIAWSTSEQGPSTS